MRIPAIAVARVSSGKQDEQSQVPDIEAFADANGYEIIHTEDVHGRSAFHGKHLAQVHAAVDKYVTHGTAQVVIFWKLDRSTRQGLEGAVELRRHIRDAGAQMMFATQPYLNTDDAASEMMFANLAILAQEESKTKSERIRIRHDANYVKGSLNGTVPWAYQIAKQGEVKKLSLKPELKPAIARIFEMIADGLSLNKVALWLEAENVPSSTRGVKKGSKGGWYPRTVADIIRNTTYMGIHKTSRGPVECDAAVTAQLFRAANGSLETRPKRGAPRPEGRAMLAGLAYCPDCDRESPMYRVNRKFYRCTGRGPVNERKGCGNAVNLAVTDEIAFKALSSLTERVTDVRRVADSTQEKIDSLKLLRASVNQDADDYMEQVSAYTDQIKELSSLLGTFQPVIITERDETYSEEWSKLQGDARNDYLKSKGVRFYATRNPEKVPEFIAGLGARIIATGSKGYRVDSSEGVTLVTVWGHLR